MPNYRIPQLKLPLDHQMSDIGQKICSTLGIKPSNIISWNITRKSFDARDKNDIHIIYAVVAKTRTAIHGRGENKDWSVVGDNNQYVFPFQKRMRTDAAQPVIVGEGPAGLFCALILAENGFSPLVLERGEDAATRWACVRRFWETGVLQRDSNMQFGEGGAGTFSDGKLNTSVGDTKAFHAKIFQEFIEAGAPPEIAYLHKPHIGTDYLVTVVQNLRKKIERLGGTVRFNARVTALETVNGQIKAVVVNGTEHIEASTVVLAIGHSARDTFEELSHGPLVMVPKPFAIGLRIEHPQEMIQRNQFGRFWNHPNLGAADYKLTYQASNGRGVYSFCMCPGGYVVNSSSEPDMIACNGMSDFARDARNANSAIVVTVRPEDFGSSDILAGIAFQRTWEHAAYRAANVEGGFAMPVQRLEDFFAGRPSTRFGSIEPCAKGATRLSDLNTCLPDYAVSALKEGIRSFDRTIAGFAQDDALLTGVETRTSSPIRIVRDDSLQSNIKGLYPCGEGAGYAGGIMSAAMDGIRVAEEAARTLSES